MLWSRMVHNVLSNNNLEIFTSHFTVFISLYYLDREPDLTVFNISFLVHIYFQGQRDAIRPKTEDSRSNCTVMLSRWAIEAFLASVSHLFALGDRLLRV